jgi:hypothetical protein
VSNYRDSWEYKTGTVAELKLATKLRNAGCLVSQVRHGTAVAPLLYGWTSQDHIVLPDLQVFWPARVCPVEGHAWVECKHKSTAGVMHEMGDLKTTGIDLRLWQEYDRLRQATGYPVVLAFIQQKQDGVFLADLDNHRIPAVGAARGQMVFWALDYLQRVCSYAELMATQAASQQLEMPLFYPPQVWDQPPLW